jgi:hypothetical protein
MVDGEVPLVNQAWSKRIPSENRSTRILCLGFLLAIDLLIAISSPMLASFGIPMLIAYGFFELCAWFEKERAPRFQPLPQVGRDGTIISLIATRNVIIIMNVIPVVQIFGLLLSPVAFVVELIILALIAARDSDADKAAAA